MNIVHLGSGAHSSAQSLLPWYASGRLEGEDLAQVEAHLASCARCRADVEIERRLQAAYSSSAASGDVEQGLARMRQCIGAEEANPRRRSAAAAPVWMRWLLAGQFAAIVLLVVVLRPAAPPADPYRSLGAAGPGSVANALVMFRPDATEQQMRSALRQIDAQLVGGPTATNAYLLQVPAAGHAAALARLRLQPAVSLAESLDAGTVP